VDWRALRGGIRGWEDVIFMVEGVEDMLGMGLRAVRCIVRLRGYM
jgi:hypothetical protein